MAWFQSSLWVNLHRFYVIIVFDDQGAGNFLLSLAIKRYIEWFFVWAFYCCPHVIHLHSLILVIVYWTAHGLQLYYHPNSLFCVFLSCIPGTVYRLVVWFWITKSQAEVVTSVERTQTVTDEVLYNRRNFFTEQTDARYHTTKLALSWVSHELQEDILLIVRKFNMWAIWLDVRGRILIP